MVWGVYLAIRPEPLEIILGSLPRHILMVEYAKERAFKINELVGLLFEDSLEWYGFTLADQDHTELIVDIGLPQNDLNLQDYTSLGSERIAQFQEGLPKDVIINGWIHSHGALNYKHFSHTDEQNNLIGQKEALNLEQELRELLLKQLLKTQYVM